MSRTSNCGWCGRIMEYDAASQWKNVYCSEKCKQEHKKSKTSDSTTSESSSGGCFIATSVYGNYDHPIVLDLRQFRDNWLAKSIFGRKFIQWYYRKGPILASWIDKTKSRKLFALSLIVKPLHFFVKLFRLHK